MNQGNDYASLLDWVIELNDLDAIFKRIFNLLNSNQESYR